MNSKFNDVFTFDDMKNAYKDVINTKKGNCKVDSDCPGDLKCLYENHCSLRFTCLENNYSKCYTFHNETISDKYNKNCNTNDDCLSNSCLKNKCDGRLLWCTVGNGDIKCGLDFNESCKSDSECYEDNCKEGLCKQYDMSKGSNRAVNEILIGSGIVIVLLIIAIIFCCRIVRRNRNKN